MVINMWVIKNKSNNSYYQKTLFKGQRHFVTRIEEAKLMSKHEAKERLNNFNYPQYYMLVERKKKKVKHE